jgi:hypothetical protein
MMGGSAQESAKWRGLRQATPYRCFNAIFLFRGLQLRELRGYTENSCGPLLPFLRIGSGGFTPALEWDEGTVISTR